MATSEDVKGIDPDQLELIERRLSEKIEADLRGRLFKSYLGVGSVVPVVLGYVGFNVISETKKGVQEFFNDRLKVFDETIADINKKATTVDVTADLIQRAVNNLQSVADSAKPQIAVVKTYADQVQDLTAKTKDLQSSLAVQQAADVDKIKGLSDQLSSLADEVQKLASAINGSQIAGAPVQQTAQQVAETSGDISTSTKDIQTTIANAKAPSTVFLQYDMSKELAQAIADNLAKEGFLVPGIDFEAGAAGLNEIRYYWDADRPAAAILAEAATRALQAAIPGAPEVTIRSLTNWPNRKPGVGTLELWLGGPDTTAPAAQ